MIKNIIFGLSLLLLFGCGHSFVNVDKGIGLHVKIPLPDS